MKKIISLFIVCSIVLSGCSSENNNKNKPVNKTIQKDNNQEEVKQEKKEEVKQTEKLEHDKEVARTFVNDSISFGINNVDINTRGAILSVPPGISTIPLYAEDRIETIEGNINIVPLSEFVDVYNTYNRHTYNEEHVIDNMKEIIRANPKLTYIELDEKSSDKSKSEIKELFANQDTIVFFKKDKVIAYNVIYGIGGVGFPIAAPYDQWVFKGDLIEIPMVGSITGEYVNTVVISLNDKEYTGGNKKTLYYYYGVIKK